MEAIIYNTRLAERSGDPDTVIDLTLATGDLKDRTDWCVAHHVASDHLLCQLSVKYCLKHTTTRRKHPYFDTKDTGIWGKVRNLARSQKPKPNFKYTNAPDWWTEEVDQAWIRKNHQDRTYMRMKAQRTGVDDEIITAILSTKWNIFSIYTSPSYFICC